MATRGSSFDAGPDACPFIALELDRDRRSERPDYRHRCYAEQVPAPRTIAHQERYCLSPNFSGCPIFQDWALRAAARPVPLPPGYEGRRGPSDARAAATGAAAAGAAAPADEPAWPDSMDAASAAAAAAAAGSISDGGAAEQLGAFDAPPAAEPEPHASPGFDDSADADLDAGPSRYAAPLAAAGAAAVIADDDAPFPSTVEPDQSETDGGALVDAADVAPVPAFLAARSARPKTPVNTDDRITREEVVPSWDLTDRYGAQSSGRGDPESSGGGDGTFSKILTAVAIVIIIALGVAAVVLVPGLLNGTPGTTPRPSLALASRSPLTTSVAGLETPTVAPATPVLSAEPTTDATPGPTPRTYRVKSGDTIAKIAKRFGITVEALRALNPAIADTDHIEVRQILIIPPPSN